MTTSFFSRTACVALLLAALAGCASVEQNPYAAHPGFGSAPTPAAPQPSPLEPVQRTPVPVPPPGTTPGQQGSVTPPVTPVKAKVAILLPLSGKNADLGQAMLNAAQQAVFDAATTNFELMPRDTGVNEGGAETAARDAIASGAQLLIGPLFATNVPDVKQVAQASNINVLTLSSDASVGGANVYVMGFAPDAQVERIVNYAAAHGLKHFGVLVPSNPYGALVGQAFQTAVARAGGTVVDMETYDPAKRDSNMYIAHLAQKRDAIDALFLPEGGTELVTIAGQLANAGIDSQHVRLLGTGLWDVPNLASQSHYLISGWYAASDPAARRAFVTTYTSTYGQAPPRLATLAYDATALAAVLAKRNAPFDQASLTNPNGFAGLDGIFRLTRQGTVERGLAVNEVTAEGSRAIDAAPATFARSLN